MTDAGRRVGKERQRRQRGRQPPCGCVDRNNARGTDDHLKNDVLGLMRFFRQRRVEFKEYLTGRRQLHASEAETWVHVKEESGLLYFE